MTNFDSTQLKRIGGYLRSIDVSLGKLAKSLERIADHVDLEKMNGVYNVITPAIDKTKPCSERRDVLASAYAMTQTSFKEYQEKAVEMLGEKKHEEIKEAVLKDHAVETLPTPEKDYILGTGYGDTLLSITSIPLDELTSYDNEWEEQDGRS